MQGFLPGTGELWPGALSASCLGDVRQVCTYTRTRTVRDYHALLPFISLPLLISFFGVHPNTVVSLIWRCRSVPWKYLFIRFACSLWYSTVTPALLGPESTCGRISMGRSGGACAEAGLGEGGASGFLSSGRFKSALRTGWHNGLLRRVARGWTWRCCCSPALRWLTCIVELSAIG